MSARDRIIIVVVLAVAAVAAAWTFVVQPRRTQASKLGAQVSAEQTQLDSARAQVAQGVAAQREFANDYTQVVRLGEAVPADDEVPSLIYQIQGAASRAHVDFRTLQVASSSSGSTPAPSSSSSSSSSSNSSSGSQSSSALPPGVAIGPAGFPAEQFTFALQGNFFHLADFFNRLRKFVQANNNQLSISGRLMSVNGISFSAAPQGFPQITANVSATTYLEQPSQGLTAGATSAGPAGTSSTTTSGASSTPSTPAAAAAATPVTR
jgi:type II secretory pathway pseudopilin PulG